MSILKKYIGPSSLVTAAFIGPGTLTVCTIAGASNGYSLIWVLVFATVATIVLQEMAARLGLITQKGLGEAIRNELRQPVIRVFGVTLVFTAIVIGNAAYEAGNISGAVIGIDGLLGTSRYWPLVIGAMAFLILFIGKFKIIEKVLVGLVLVMSIVFIITAIVSKPSFSSIAHGLVPTISSDNQLSILALIGTTIVPYNLFLHASSVKAKWHDVDQLKDLRKENAIAISLGGLISIAIIVTSATTLFGKNVDGMSDMANQLEPVLGSWANYFLGIGLFAAGISSAITAPLAAAYTAKGIFGWTEESNSLKFRSVWMTILLVGTVFSMLSYKPITVIQVAQIANGILLPVVVFFLVYINNRKDLLGPYVNKQWQNILSAFVILISILISFRSLNSVLNFI